MTLGKLFYTLGIILIIYAAISGINFFYKFNEAGSNSNFSYSLNGGKIILGVILIYLGNHLKKEN